MVDRHSIGAGKLRATIAAEGAELTGLDHDAGGELLWQAGPQWPRHAPVLFPIVGRLAGDTLHHAGADYRLTQHGFARDSRFDWVERSRDHAVLRLTDSAASRGIFPFAFSLELTYLVEDETLSVTTRVGNPGTAVLPCGVGAHPGFRWPLVDGVPPDSHRLEFAAVEQGPALSVEGGLLGAPKPIPFDGRVLPLAPSLFARDALVLPGIASRGLRYVAADTNGRERASLDFQWEGYKDLGLWSAPKGAPFLCIEPWYSMASPVGWDGEFGDKPGILTLLPGETRDFIWRVTASLPE